MQKLSALQLRTSSYISILYIQYKFIHAFSCLFSLSHIHNNKWIAFEPIPLSHCYFFFFFWLSNVRAIPRHLTISAFGERCVHVRECSVEGLIAIVIFGYVITVVACIKWRNKKQKKTKYVLTSRRTFILFHSSRANANFCLDSFAHFYFGHFTFTKLGNSMKYAHVMLAIECMA